MKISDIEKANRMIEHFNQLNDMISILKNEKDYIRLTIDNNGCGFSGQSSKSSIGILFKSSPAQELYEGFHLDLYELLLKKQKRVHVLLNEMGIDCEMSDLIIKNKK